MFALKFTLFMAVCLAISRASPVDFMADGYENQIIDFDQVGPSSIISRHARSPEGGSVGIDYRKDENGRVAVAQYKQNIFSSADGDRSLDAHAHASRNFDHNSNAFGGGVQGNWSPGSGGSADFTKDNFGRQASVQLNQNLFTSRDGRGTIDAYAQGTRNFDYNYNNFGGGIQGRYRF
uniref:Attacin C-terminal domain-containing protein n=1 Tax=Musca domestica TaxID=7370 RepID=A0A1I8NKL0_MUSDO